jgi:hypothetical protein
VTWWLNAEDGRNVAILAQIGNGCTKMPLSDEDAAALAISSLVDLTSEQESARSKIDILLKSGDEDSFVDIQELFAHYNVLYFRSLLIPRVEVSWSPRLTL